jgi:hypothetical protein
VRSDQHIRFPDAALQSRAWRSDVAVDALLGDVAEIAGPGRARLAREAANDWQMGDDGPRRQPMFLPQIITEPLEYLVVPSDRRQWRRHDHARLARHRQQPLQRRPVARLDALLPWSMPSYRATTRSLRSVSFKPQ